MNHEEKVRKACCREENQLLLNAQLLLANEKLLEQQPMLLEE